MISRNGKLNGQERAKLLKMLRLLASPHAGERDNAGLLAHRFLDDRGLDWDDVLAGDGAAFPGPAAWEHPPSWSARRGPPGELGFALANLGRLSRWEASFVIELSRLGRWSPKQAAKLAEIVAELRPRNAA